MLAFPALRVQLFVLLVWLFLLFITTHRGTFIDYAAVVHVDR
jgi:hypothetical protein